MERKIGCWVLLLLIFAPVLVSAQSRSWTLVLSGGAIHNFRTPLHIEQKQAEDIELDASYRTEPFNLPVYYDVRIGNWKQDKGWELKFTHHKLILDNLPPEVQRFSITNGFNLLTVNRLWRCKDFTLSVGSGMVITHPESTVRGKAYPENRGIFNKGFYISGPTIEAAVARQLNLTDRWFLLGEGRLTGSYVNVPIADGEARVTNLAFHVLFGIGARISSE